METTRSAALLRLARSFAGRRAAGAEEGAEGGFTLIELMVVLLIMAILLAIAIPTFLGVKGGAQNRATQSDLTNAVTSAKAAYTNIGTYPAAASLIGTLQTSEPELNFTNTGASTGTSHQIDVAVSADNAILILAAQAQNGRCWYVEDNEEATATSDGLTGATTQQGITYTSGANNGATPALCLAANPTGITAASWKSTYPAS